MSTLNIHLRQAEKFWTFSLMRLQEEIYEMYDDIIYSPSKRDLSFFVLVFFLSLSHEKTERPFLDTYLENNLWKLKDFTSALNRVGRKLKKDEYSEYKEKFGLTDFFKNDTFFVLLFALRNSEYFLSQHIDFFKECPHLGRILDYINQKYWVDIEHFYNQYQEIFIEDDRVDSETWESLDLSKSIYRTIEMRLSRKMENSLKRFTEIKEIRSQSPLDLQFTQQIDPELIIYIWDQFKVLAHLGWETTKNLSQNSLVSTALGWLIIHYYTKKSERSNDGTDKKNTCTTVINNHSENNNWELLLLSILIQDLLKSQEKKDDEIIVLRRRIEELERDSLIKNQEKKKRLTRMSIKLRNLSNLSVDVQWKEED